MALNTGYEDVHLKPVDVVRFLLKMESGMFLREDRETRLQPQQIFLKLKEDNRNNDGITHLL